MRRAFFLKVLDDLSVIAILPMTDSATDQGPPHPAGHPRSTSLINSANRTPGITQLPGFPHTTHNPGLASAEMLIRRTGKADEPTTFGLEARLLTRKASESWLLHGVLAKATGIVRLPRGVRQSG